MPWPPVNVDSPFCDECGWLDKSADFDESCTAPKPCNGIMKRAVDVQPQFFQ